MRCMHAWEPVYVGSNDAVTYSTARIVDCQLCSYCGALLRGEQVTYDAMRLMDQRAALSGRGAYQL